MAVSRPGGRSGSSPQGTLTVERPDPSVSHNGNGTSQNGATNGSGATNGATATNGTLSATLNGGPVIRGDMDPCEAGQLEAAAAIQNDAGEAPKAAKAEAARPETPDAADTGSPYVQAGFSSFQRTLQIYAFALTFAFRYWRLGKPGTYKKMEGGMSPENISAKKAELARWLREGLIRLGPTFIKIGQQFSTRVDVLSKEFIAELELLQDRVPAVGAAAVRNTLETAFGKKVEDLFEDFDFEPIAAASLGQVHLATLDGRRVVVKVQRPGLRELFRVDLKNVRVIAQWLQKLDPKSDGAARDWVAIYDECSRILFEEIDYRMEAEYASSFAANFKDVDWVKVPEIKRDLLAPEVLVMEYVPGVKINNAEAIDAMGLDRDRLARLSVESYLQQLLRHGLFHADPHPGNVAVDAVNGGRLIYYDFGMMGRIQPFVREGLRELFYGVYQRDTEKCLDALETMGVLVGGDRTSIKRTAEFFLKSFEDRLAEQKKEREVNPDSQNSFKPQRTKDDSKARRKEILSTIGEDLLVASADKPFRFPAEFTFVVRSFTVLDGIGKSLSPRFDISEISAPYARELILDGKPAFTRLQDRVAKGVRRNNKAVKGLFDSTLKIDEINEALKRIENGDSKPRVRALEVERAVQRLVTSQTLMTCLVVASMFVNVGTVLSVSALPLGSTMSFVAGGACALVAMVNFLKLKQAEKKEAQLLGAA